MRSPTACSMAVLLACCVLAGCQREVEQPQNLVNIPPGAPDDESWNTTILLTDSVTTKAKVKVGHARRYIAKMETLLDSGVYVEFYAPDGSLSATLIADSARIDDRTKDMSAFGAVHVNSDRNKTTVDTDLLNWSNSRRRLFSDAHVKVVDRVRGRMLEGTGYESDEALQHYNIHSASGRTFPSEP
jgi:LPS export ABC transporter protein LptC